MASIIERERRVLSIEFGIRVGFFEEYFNYSMAKKELEKAKFG
jgi:hypothetical protein